MEGSRAEGQERDQDNESVKSTESRASGSGFKLTAIFENLVLCGLISLAKWDFALDSMKINPDVLSDPELFGVYIFLTQVFQTISQKLLQDISSQDKIPYVQNKPMSLNEIMRLASPTLKRKAIRSKTFSSDCMNKLLVIIKDILYKFVDNGIAPTEKTKSQKRKVDKKTKRSKKP